MIRKSRTRIETLHYKYGQNILWSNNYRCLFEDCERNKITNPFSKETELANANFVRGFLERHKDSSLRKPKEWH